MFAPRQQPSESLPLYVPYKIDINTYEQYWDKLSQENSYTVQTRIRTEQDVKNVFGQIGLGILDVKGFDVLLAG